MLQHSIYATKHHKKSIGIFFIFFSFFLLALNFISQLITTEMITIQIIFNRWEYLTKISPQASSNIQEQSLLKHDKLISGYEHSFVIVLTLACFLFFLFGVLSLIFRKEEIKSLVYIGFKKIKILTYFFTELLIPMVISFFVITVFLFFFQQAYTTSSISANQYFASQIATEKAVVANFNSDISNVPVSEKMSHIPESSSEKDATLVPFNHYTLFQTKYYVDDFGHHLFRFLKNFIFLFIFSMIGYVISLLVIIRTTLRRSVV